MEVPMPGIGSKQQLRLTPQPWQLWMLLTHCTRSEIDPVPPQQLELLQSDPEPTALQRDLLESFFKAVTQPRFYAWGYLWLLSSIPPQPNQIILRSDDGNQKHWALRLQGPQEVISASPSLSSTLSETEENPHHICTLTGIGDSVPALREAIKKETFLGTWTWPSNHLPILFGHTPV